MRYEYARKPTHELDRIAEVILDRYRHRKQGLVVDIEGILEDLQITILPRRGCLSDLVHGYTPKDPKYIVLAEGTAGHAPTYRSIVAEELCHIILEYDLWEAPTLPEGAAGHELTAQQHKDIENDADYLACAILMPKIDYVAQFESHKASLETAATDRDRIIIACCKELTRDFQVWLTGTFRRAMYLKLITPDELERNFTSRIPL